MHSGMRSLAGARLRSDLTIGGCSAGCFPGQPGQVAAAPQAAFADQLNAFSLGCPPSPFCASQNQPCVVLETGNAPGCVTRFWHCTQAPVCLVTGHVTCNLCSAFCLTHPPCVVSPQVQCIGVGPGQVPPGTPVERAQALQPGFGAGNVTGWWYCFPPTRLHCSFNELILRPAHAQYAVLPDVGEFDADASPRLALLSRGGDNPSHPDRLCSCVSGVSWRIEARHASDPRQSGVFPHGSWTARRRRNRRWAHFDR